VVHFGSSIFVLASFSYIVFRGILLFFFNLSVFSIMYLVIVLRIRHINNTNNNTTAKYFRTISHHYGHEECFQQTAPINVTDTLAYLQERETANATAGGVDDVIVVVMVIVDTGSECRRHQTQTDDDDQLTDSASLHH